MASTFTPNKSIEQPAAGSYNDTWATPVNANWEDIDNAFGGTTSIVVTGVPAGNYTLSLAQYQPPNIEFSGVLSGSLVYVVPVGVGGVWTLWNNATGPYSIVFASGGGGSIFLPPGSREFVVVDASGNVQNAQTATSSANPTAKVGLTPVDGTAGSFMTSDSAPALDQEISPTWTGTHTFAAGVVLNPDVELNGTAGIVAVATQAAGDSSPNAASTQFVSNAVATGVNNALADSPTLGGIPKAATAGAGASTTQLATTQFVTEAVATQAAQQIVKVGITTTLTGGSNEIVFPIPFPTACEGVVVTPFGSSATYAITSYSPANFFLNTGNAEPFTWIAVGY